MKYFAAHFVFGVLTVISHILNPVIPLIMFVTFVLYEFDQELNLRDLAHEEIREYAYGLAVGVVVCLIGSLI